MASKLQIGDQVVYFDIEALNEANIGCPDRFLGIPLTIKEICGANSVRLEEGKGWFFPVDGVYLIPKVGSVHDAVLIVCK